MKKGCVKMDHDVVVHGLLLTDKSVFSNTILLLMKWQHLEHSRDSHKMQLELIQPLNTDFSSFLLTVSVAILTPVASCNLLSVLDVSIPSLRERCDRRSFVRAQKTMDNHAMVYFHKTCLHSIPKNPSPNTETNLYIPENRSRLTFTTFTPFSTTKFLFQSNF